MAALGTWAPTFRHPPRHPYAPEAPYFHGIWFALSSGEESNQRASRAGIDGHREYNSGWHTCIDLRNLLDCSEAIARSAIERKESRGGHFREDYPDKVAEFGTFNISTKRQPDGSMKVSRIPLKEIPAELKQVIEEQQQ